MIFNTGCGREMKVRPFNRKHDSIVFILEIYQVAAKHIVLSCSIKIALRQTVFDGPVIWKHIPC